MAKMKLALVGSVTTTNATPTVIVSQAISPSSVAYARATVTARDTSSNAGYASQKTAGITANGSGGISLVGTVATLLETCDAALGIVGLGAPTFTITFTSGVVNVTVTGKAGVTLAWDCDLLLLIN